ncbi:MAG: hypothetical protein AAFQ89_17190 [Cyanobacteria bacterium J06626_18]
MTASVMFSVPTTESVDSLRSKLGAAWKGRGLSVSVFQESNSEELTCYLDWWFGYEDQKDMVRRVFKILLSASITGDVFYYRSSDMPTTAPTSSYSIRIEEIFLDEFSPTMGYYKEERYRVVNNHGS